MTRSEADTGNIFEPVKMVLIKRIPVADDPDGIFYDEFDKLVCVARGESHLATWIDPSTQEKHVQFFECDNARAFKFSIPRPIVQGNLGDGDMHGGQQFIPLMDIEIQ